MSSSSKSLLLILRSYLGSSRFREEDLVWKGGGGKWGLDISSFALSFNFCFGSFIFSHWTFRNNEPVSSWGNRKRPVSHSCDSDEVQSQIFSSAFISPSFNLMLIYNHCFCTLLPSGVSRAPPSISSLASLYGAPVITGLIGSALVHHHLLGLHAPGRDRWQREGLPTQAGAQ